MATKIKIHILINNAGIFNPHFELTHKDGLESNLAINHIAPFLFTTSLIPALQVGARIVNVSSCLQVAVATPIHNDSINDPNATTGIFERYNNSKLANVLFTQRLQKVLGPSYYVNCLHPGTASTNLTRGLHKLSVLDTIIRWSCLYLRHRLRHAL